MLHHLLSVQLRVRAGGSRAVAVYSTVCPFYNDNSIVEYSTVSREDTYYYCTDSTVETRETMSSSAHIIIAQQLVSIDIALCPQDAAGLLHIFVGLARK